MRCARNPDRMRALFFSISFLSGLLLASAGHASSATDICPANADPCVVATAKAVAGGSILDFGTRQLDVRMGGSLTVSGGLMTINADSVRLESGGDLIGA